MASAKVLLKKQAKAGYNSVNHDQNRFDATASQINGYASASNKVKQAEHNGVQEIGCNLPAPISNVIPAKAGIGSPIKSGMTEERWIR